MRFEPIGAWILGATRRPGTTKPGCSSSPAAVLQGATPAVGAGSPPSVSAGRATSGQDRAEPSHLAASPAAPAPAPALPDKPSISVNLVAAPRVRVGGMLATADHASVDKA